MSVKPRDAHWQLQRARLGTGSIGVLLVLGFFSLSQTATGFEIGFFPDWANSTAGELHLWLAYTLLLVPGGVLLGYSVAPYCQPFLVSMQRHMHTWPQAHVRMGIVAFGVGFAMLGAILSQNVFLGFPFTDDGQAMRFGGQVLASGKLMVPLPESIRALPKLYLYARHGMYTSFDWPGSLLTWAIAERTHLGALLYPLIAGVTATLIVVIAYRQLGRTGAFMSMVLLVCSPMFVLLSGTSHPQSVSRVFIAATLLGYTLTLHQPRAWHYALTGGAFGLALCFRPIESTALLSPLLIELSWRSLRDRTVRRHLFALAGCMVVPLCLFALYNAEVTGHPLIPPRYALNELPDRPLSHSRGILAAFKRSSIFWDRFSSNFIYNITMLILWCLGPIGALLFGAGCLVNRTTKLLSLGVFFALLITFLHDDLGLHVVGPIHYSEASILILVVILHGLWRLIDLAKSFKMPSSDLGFSMIAAIMIACSTLTTMQCQALRKQADIYAMVHHIFDHPSFDNTVVIGPPYYAIWQRFPSARRTGTFVFQWPPANPYRPDRVIFAHDSPEMLDALKRDFPHRRFVRFEDEITRFVYTPIDP